MKKEVIFHRLLTVVDDLEDSAFNSGKVRFSEKLSAIETKASLPAGTAAANLADAIREGKHHLELVMDEETAYFTSGPHRIGGGD